ncbi:DUF6475 domain-containing protein [Burkholderia ubonensis]|uniref:DUF6475 domain-containing protein n=1 Tax=Burkholderia ubonensis TaxID=101571 RepID=UPI000757F4DF|nr:DUF6475 domain-containing protein [Burkholderia ubonensis]KVG77203.1 hypothetical protein WJ34_02225 [Burkholderia ubonensis]KVH15810.1 hypothetical protein WJ37_31255 [Burkholderia ubonensis]KVH53100.1 hypothetical protein WJ38_02860 [Burkholderia ubonensis]KVH82347.1 hypothetical protein WJ43_26230 [Burkholderia ubonensis]KVM28995.1 hypothetical protein WJ55_23775 [Burkholderia ubonensis]
MIDSNRGAFAELISGVYAFYGREASDFALSVWWAAMQPFDLAAVHDAMNRHCVNPDSGQFLPKPADIVKMVQGSTQDSALVAWAKVDRAIRSCGTYNSVVFDDALIHRVIVEMGGWVLVGGKGEEEWPFVRNEFVNRYRGYKMRSETPEYQPVLIGMAEAQNNRTGHKSQPPVLIGDARAAHQVMLAGHDKPMLGFVRMSPELAANRPVPMLGAA